MMESLQSVAMIFLMVYAGIYALLILALIGFGAQKFWRMCKEAREATKKDRENRI